MTLHRDHDPHTGLDVLSPLKPFEVDGILYTPPWIREDWEDTDLSVHYQPMLELKPASWCGGNTNECDCWFSEED